MVYVNGNRCSVMLQVFRCRFDVALRFYPRLPYHSFAVSPPDFRSLRLEIHLSGISSLLLHSQLHLLTDFLARGMLRSTLILLPLNGLSWTFASAHCQNWTSHPLLTRRRANGFDCPCQLHRLVNMALRFWARWRSGCLPLLSHCRYHLTSVINLPTIVDRRLLLSTMISCYYDWYCTQTIVAITMAIVVLINALFGYCSYCSYRYIIMMSRFLLNRLGASSRIQ